MGKRKPVKATVGNEAKKYLLDDRVKEWKRARGGEGGGRGMGWRWERDTITRKEMYYSKGKEERINIWKDNIRSHTPLGAAAASAASLTFIKLSHITIARYIITITSTYTQSKTVLFPYSLLINIKGLGEWDTVKLRWATTKICSTNLHHPVTPWFHKASSSVWQNIFRFFRPSASGK